MRQDMAEKDRLENGPGYYQGQRDVKTFSKNLIMGEHLAEEIKKKKKM